MRKSSSVSSMLLSIAVVLAISPASTAAQVDRPDDIPGVPLSGTSVRGLAGGEIIDQVWRLSILEGRVAVIRVNGEPGAELGLYLFDETSQSVTTSLPIKSSARPGPTQEVTAALPAGTYYINVNGRNVDRAYGYQLTTDLYPDITAPLLSPELFGSYASTSNPQVSIIINAVDSLSGVAFMRSRLEDSEWGPWRPYSPTINVNLGQEELTYIVYLQVANGLGLISQTASVSVTLDTTRPVATISGDVIDGITSRQRPNIYVSFDEPMRIETLTSSSFLTEAFGREIPTKVFYDPTTRTARFAPLTPLEPGRTYLVSISGMRDVAGNVATNTTQVSFTYLLPTRIQFSIDRKIFVSGEPITIRGATSGIPAGTIATIEWRNISDSEWLRVASARINRDQFSSVITATQSGDIRIRYTGDSIHAPTLGASIRINVLPQLGFQNRTDAVLNRVAGRNVALKMYATPNLRFILVKSRCGPTFSSCRVVERTPVQADAAGYIWLPWIAERGKWNFRLVAPAQDGLESRRVGPLRISVE